MSLIKLGEALVIGSNDIQSFASAMANPVVNSVMADDAEVLTRFRKVAAELKKIAPKAKDFLYFSAIMMHSAEAAILNKDGSLKKDASGKYLNCEWIIDGDSLKWSCSDPSILPIKNSNGDIFPEHALIKAHRNWISKPLCLDHKSSSVEFVRGIIVDTYYDYKHKRVIALCALDKLNYPDLAHKVSTGYAASVSMGTAVGRAICYDCGRVARAEADFCTHMKHKSGYGEINEDLTPIELSIVVNGADPNAKIKHIVASANSAIAQYVELKKTAHKMIDPSTIDGIIEQLQKLKSDAEEVVSIEKSEGESPDDSAAPVHTASLTHIETRLGQIQQDVNKLLKLGTEDRMTVKNAYFQGTEEPTLGKPKYEKDPMAEKIRNTEDKQMLGLPPFPQVGSVTEMYPGDAEKKKALQRSSAELEAGRLRRQAALEKVKSNLSKEGYFQGGGGVNEPTLGKPKYEKEDADSIRAKEDKQMVGAPPFPEVGKVDGLYGKDLETKKKVLRAKLEAKLSKVSQADGSPDIHKTNWKVYEGGTLLLSASAAEIMGAQPEFGYNAVVSKDFGRKILGTLRSEGVEKTNSMLKSAQAMPEIPAPSAPQAPVGASDTAPGADSAMPGLDMGDSGKKGDPKETIPDTIRQCQNNLSDLSMAFDSVMNESGDEVSGLKDLSSTAPKSAAAKMLMVKTQIRGKLAAELPKAIASLKNRIEALRMCEAICADTKLTKSASSAQASSINSMIAEEIADAKNVIQDSFKTMASVVFYAKGSEQLKKLAAKELSMLKSAQMLPGIGESSPQVEKSLQSMPGHQSRTNPTTGKSETLKGDKWFCDGTNLYWDGTKYVSGHDAKPTVKAPGAGAGQTAYNPSASGAGSVNGGIMTPEERGKALTQGGMKDRLPSAATGISTSDPSGFGTQTLDSSKADDKDAEDKKMDEACADDVTITKKDGTEIEMGKDTAKDVLKTANFDLSTKEGRSAYRAEMTRLAKDSSTMPMQSDMMRAHPNGMKTKLDTKPSGNLDVVENLVEKHNVMEEIAKAPPRIRKLAEELQAYIKSGKISEDMLPGLVAQGLDGDAVKYWKAFYSQAKDGGSQFAAELVKDVSGKKAEAAAEVMKTKFARAYALAHAMQARGMCPAGETALSKQVDETVKWSDEHFMSVKAMVETTQIAKTASSMPLVGMRDETVSDSPQASADLKNKLSAMWAHKVY